MRVSDKILIGNSRAAGGQSRGRRYVLLAPLCLMLLALAPSACSFEAAPTGVSIVSPTVASPIASSLPTASPTWTPIIIATTQDSSAATRSTSAEPATALGTPAAAPTVTTPPTATALPTITPTRLITITPTPSLTPTPRFTPTPLPAPAVSGDVLNVLLFGLDTARNIKSQNTDAIMVVAVNRDTKQVSLLSIPRDLWVYIPTYGWSRINTAHKRGYLADYPGGGPGLLMKTIEMNLGIPIDHWARVDYGGFIRAVNELGGVDMTVNCPVNLLYHPPSSEQEQEMYLEPGVYHMDGWTALKYVRTRRNTSDFDRARRQQQFLKALWNQTKRPETITKIPAVWSAMADSLSTDLNLLDVVSMAPIALEISPQRVQSRYIGPRQTTNWVTADGWQVLLPDYEKIQQIVASMYAPPSALEDEVAGESARVQVRNGTYRHQLAKIGADQLRWHGFNIVDTGLADNPNYKQTKIIVFNETPSALALLTKLLGVKPENVIHMPDPNQPADLQVILGENYDPCQK